MTVARNYLSTVVISALAVVIAALRVIVFSNTYGANAETDAYFNAYLWFRMFFEDVPSLLLPMLVPAYLLQLRTGSVEQAGQLLRHWVWSRGGQFAALLVVLGLASPWLLHWTAAGLSAEANQLAGQMLLATLATAPVLFLACLLRVHLESRQKFVASGLFRIILLIVSTVSMVFSTQLGIWAAMWGLTAGTIVGLLWLWIAYRRDIRSLAHAESQLPNESVLEAGVTADGTRWSLVWILASVLLQRSAMLVDLHFGSVIEPGAITMFNQIGTLISLPVMILVQSLSTVLVPRAAHMQATGDWHGLRQGLRRVCLGVGGISLIVVLVLQLIADPVVRLLFSRGAFDEHQMTEMVALLRLYAFSVFPLSLHLACLGVTASKGAVRVLVGIPLVALVVRYLLLASRVETLSLDDLVYAHMAYHGTWVLGLLGFLSMQFRSNDTVCEPTIPRLGDCSGAKP